MYSQCTGVQQAGLGTVSLGRARLHRSCSIASLEEGTGHKQHYGPTEDGWGGGGQDGAGKPPEQGGKAEEMYINLIILCKVYKVQCEKEKQFHLISQLMKMSVSPCHGIDGRPSQTQGKASVQVQQDMEVGVLEICQIERFALVNKSKHRCVS